MDYSSEITHNGNSSEEPPHNSGVPAVCYGGTEHVHLRTEYHRDPVSV